MYKAILLLAICAVVVHGTTVHPVDLKINQVSRDEGKCICWFSDNNNALISVHLEGPKCDKDMCNRMIKTAPTMITVAGDSNAKLDGPYYRMANDMSARSEGTGLPIFAGEVGSFGPRENRIYSSRFVSSKP
jgi:hypothetical protein